MIAAGLFHGLVSTTSSTIASSLDKNSSSVVSVVSDCEDSSGRPAKRQHLIPPEVLVPLSMKSTSSYSTQAADQQTNRWNVDNGNESFQFIIPEGRVHGGGLMSLLGGNLSNIVHGV